MEQKIGFCRNCGRVVKVSADSGIKQSEWDEAATAKCGCKKVEAKKKGKRRMHKERLTLATLCGGAVQEKIDRALEKVASNILDPNVVPDKKRTVTLKITMKPLDDDREDVAVEANVSYTLSPEMGVQTNFFVNKDLNNGNISIMEHKRGEIKGQLDFSDVFEDIEEEVDEETGEIIEKHETKEEGVLDFRRRKEG